MPFYGYSDVQTYLSLGLVLGLVLERNGSGVELRTLDYENPGSNPVLRCLNLGQVFFTLHCSSSLSCINEYLAIDSGDYVYEQPFAH